MSTHLNQEKFSLTAKTLLFPGISGWVYVPVPTEYTQLLKPFAHRGFVPVTILLGTSTWKTSLLPYGDGTQFIPLKASVRKQEHIAVGDVVTLEFWLREA